MAGKLSGSAIQTGTITSTQLSTELGPVSSELQLVGSGVSLNVSNNAVFTGNVGIGTASPGFTFETVGTVGLNTNGTSVLATFGASNNTDKYLRIRNSDGNFEIGSDSNGHYLYGNGNLPVRIFANGVNRLHVTSGGNVGIGTTSPGSKLHVIGVVDTQGLAATGTASLGYAANRWMVQFEGSSISRSYACGADASTRGTWEHYAAESDGNPLLVFAAAASGKFGAGTNTFNTNGGKLQVADGISFPATQSACSDPNTLDDYEEGTWTPSYVAGSIAGTGITYDGQYTKIGRVVHLSLKISATINDLQIGSYVLFSGLPYTLYQTSSGVVTSEDPDITSTNGFCHAGSTSMLVAAAGSPSSTQVLFCTIVAFV